jgi:hypothetical protein
MAKFNQFLDSILGRHPSAPHARRTLAFTLAVVLLLASVSPAWAITVEVESEAEGSAPPGALPGLEEGPELEPEGEETALAEAPPLASEEDEEEAPPPEYEGSSAPPASSSAPEAPEPEAQTGTTPPAVEPTYEEDGGPTYQPEAPQLVVQGESIAEPPAPSARPGGEESQGAQSAAPQQPEAPSAVPSPEPTPPATPSPAATPPADPVAPGALAGRRFHTVRPGESLWSIATALLPAGAGNAEIEAEVQRLWRLNEARIGTGDPNLILVGTVLRLR